MNFKVTRIQRIDFLKAKFREAKAISERSELQLVLLAFRLGSAFSVFWFSDETRCPSRHAAALRTVRSCVLAKTTEPGAAAGCEVTLSCLEGLLSARHILAA